jgi:hypothetical protein
MGVVIGDLGEGSDQSLRLGFRPSVLQNHGNAHPVCLIGLKMGPSL